LVDGGALPPLALEQAAVLACGENAYLSGHAAAAAYGLRPFGFSVIDVTVIGRRVRSRPGIRVHHVATIHPRDTDNLDGIPITSPARVLLEIAPDLKDRELERALDEAMGCKLVTRAAVTAMLRANPRRPGSSRLRDLVIPGRPTTLTRSDGEEAFLRLVRAAGLPPPALNQPLLNRWIVDFLWRAEKVVVEIDGDSFHSSRAARERDHRKDVALQEAGYFVVRITGRQLKQRPEEVLALVAAALATRASRAA
jgi:very-short-patch-repair endonuclease